MQTEKQLKPSEKYLLTVKEAGDYFNMGVKKMRRLAEDNIGSFSIYHGNRYLIIRQKFEEYILELAAKREDTFDETESE